MTKLTVDKNGPPVGALLAAKAAVGLNIPVSWGTDTSYTLVDGAIGATTSVGIARLETILTYSKKTVFWIRTFFYHLDPDLKRIS